MDSLYADQFFFYLYIHTIHSSKLNKVQNQLFAALITNADVKKTEDHFEVYACANATHIFWKCTKNMKSWKVENVFIK